MVKTKITQQSLAGDCMGRRSSGDSKQPVVPEWSGRRIIEDFRGGRSSWGRGWRRGPASDAPPRPLSGADLAALWWLRVGGGET